MRTLQSWPGVKNCRHEPNANVRSAAKLEQPAGIAQPSPILNALFRWPPVLPCLARPQSLQPPAGGFAVAAEARSAPTLRAINERQIH